METITITTHVVAKVICGPHCNHKRCAKVRFIADADCSYCANPIGFDEPYCDLPGGVIHARCIRPARVA